jgi:hypothetical protein
MVHDLGLTCNPIGGLVQISSLDFNAVGAVKAVDAPRLATCRDCTRKVPLYQAIATMNHWQHVLEESSQGFRNRRTRMPLGKPSNLSPRLDPLLLAGFASAPTAAQRWHQPVPMHDSVNAPSCHRRGQPLNQLAKGISFAHPGKMTDKRSIYASMMEHVVVFIRVAGCLRASER